MSHEKEMLARLDTLEAVPEAVALRERGYELLNLAEKHTVVDVGCGAGRAVAEMSRDGATAIGIDPNEDFIALARERWSGEDFRVGVAERLPFEDGQLHGYRADKVLHGVPDPAAAVREAWRVLAPGGRIVLVGQDWEGLVLESDDAEMTRMLLRARAEAIPAPRVARGYRNLLLDHGFTDATVEVHTLVSTDDSMLPLLRSFAEVATEHSDIDPQRITQWMDDQVRRAARDRFLLAMPLFLAAATRPG